MKMNKTLLSTAIGLALGLAAVQAQASTLSTGATLNIAPGVTKTSTVGTGTTATTVTSVTAGSYFAMDQGTSLSITGTEKTPVSPGTQNGIVIGKLQAYGPTSSKGQLTGPGQIDSWNFFGANGDDFTPSVAVTGNTTSGVNMSGWTVRWNAVNIPMAAGAWQPGNCSALGCTGWTFSNGVGQLTWDGVYGDTYTLNYAATVENTTTNFNGVKYFLHLTGTVSAPPAAVPLPAAVWLLGSGLIGLVGVSRRKRSNQS